MSAKREYAKVLFKALTCCGGRLRCHTCNTRHRMLNRLIARRSPDQAWSRDITKVPAA